MTGITGLYGRLANLSAILESDKIVEAKVHTEAEIAKKNLLVEAKELVRTATDKHNEFAAADCAVHAKSFADNLNRYLQSHDAIGKVDLTKLERNTQNLETRAGVPVAKRFSQTHDHRGTIKSIRDDRAHGDYFGRGNLLERMKGTAPAYWTADAYLEMASDCLLAIHEGDKQSSVLSTLQHYAGMNKKKLTAKATAAAVVALVTAAYANTTGIIHDADTRVFKNEFYLQQHGMNDALKIERQNLANVDRYLEYKCTNEVSEFATWLRDNKYAEFATHECLGYWYQQK